MPKTSKVLQFAGFLFLLVAVGTVIWLINSSGDAFSGSQLASSAKSEGTAPYAHATEASNLTKNAWGAKDAGRFDGMRAAYASKHGLRETFENGLRHPEQGGLFYARKILLECNAISGEAKKASSEQSNTYLASALERCDGLGDETSTQRLRATLHTSVSSADPLYGLVNLAQTANVKGSFGLDKAQDLLNQAIAIGDPYVLSDLMYRSILAAQYFDGQKIDFDLQNKLIAAITIASCDLGADCANTFSVVMSCLREGGCAASQIDVVLNRPPRSDADKQAIFDLSQKIEGAARDGTLSSLFANTRAS